MEGFESFSEDITKWDVLREMIDLDLSDELKNDSNKPTSSVQLLPRQDVTVYGTVPKMEQRIYAKCKECRLVFNPRDILSHKTCSGKAYSSSSLAHSLRKKIKSKSSTPKKSHSSLPLPPLFKKPPSPTSVLPSATLPELVPKVSSPKVMKISTSSTTTSSLSSSSSTSLKSDGRHSSIVSPSKSNSYHHTPKSPKSISSSDHSSKPSKSTAVENVNGNSTSSSSTSSSSSNRHKKSRKSSSSLSSSKAPEEYDPDVHCGVIEGNKGPCTRSITCSNHRIQLRKMVLGRSKDIHQLIAERKTVKEKDGKYSSSSSSVYTSPNGLDTQDVQNAYVPVLASTKDSTSYIPILPKTSDFATSSTNISEIENNFTKTADVQINSQDGVIGTVPVVYMPMSPISVMSPVEFVKIGKNIICLESPQSANSPPITTNQSVFLTIPSQQQNVKMYKTHPKPVAVPSYGAKKIGGAILLSNQRIESQRNDILMAINSNRKTVNNIQGYRTISSINHINYLHRPNILKNKGVNKVNCKRSAVDKLNISDSKQMKLATNVNGFIFHSDISESADAPQSNNCIQEKISFFNLK